MSGLSQRAWQLLELLQDGEFISGTRLAGALGISRASVYNALAGIEQHGISLQRIHARGYRLTQPWQQLDASGIRRHLGEYASRFSIEVQLEATSSNALLLQHAAQGLPSGSVLAVELQTAGKGRLGRKWHSGLGNALTFSLLWRFDCGLSRLSGLSLAVGVGIVRALHKHSAGAIGLKWPNDVMTEYGKLAGVLIEAQGDVFGPCAVVIGVGLNITLPLQQERQIDQAASCLAQVSDQLPERNRMLADMLRELAVVLDEFGQNGLVNLQREWVFHHMRQDKPIMLNMPDGSTIQGVARGINEQGELRVETAQGIREFNSGEVGAP